MTDQICGAIHAVYIPEERVIARFNCLLQRGHEGLHNSLDQRDRPWE